MIPPFDGDGDLLPGLHTATWSEFRDRFCRFVQSDRRLQHCRHLSQLLEDARTSTLVTRILVGGSMVSTKAEPNDFDCIVVLKDSVDYDSLRPDHLWIADGQRARQRYKGDIFIVREGQPALVLYVDFFSHNRQGKLVGLIEVAV